MLADAGLCPAARVHEKTYIVYWLDFAYVVELLKNQYRYNSRTQGKAS